VSIDGRTRRVSVHPSGASAEEDTMEGHGEAERSATARCTAARTAALAVGLTCSGLSDDDRIAQLREGTTSPELLAAIRQLDTLTFLSPADRERARLLLLQATDALMAAGSRPG
jgi:hypothetical protein